MGFALAKIIGDERKTLTSMYVSHYTFFVIIIFFVCNCVSVGIESGI